MEARSVHSLALLRAPVGELVFFASYRWDTETKCHYLPYLGNFPRVNLSVSRRARVGPQVSVSPLATLSPLSLRWAVCEKEPEFSRRRRHRSC